MKTDPGPYFVAIGASGGEGLNDIKHVLAALPRHTAAVVMVVLHRPSDKVSALREVLARAANMPVVIATEAEQLDEGVCYIGEPAGHLTLLSGDAAGLVAGQQSPAAWQDHRYPVQLAGAPCRTTRHRRGVVGFTG